MSLDLFVVFLCVIMLTLLFVGGHRQRKLAAERALNPSQPSAPLSYSAKRIRNYRLGYVAILLLYISVVLIPTIYDWKAVIPPFEQLQVTAGELTYKVAGKRGEDRLTGIRTDSNTMYFTCGPGKLAHTDCLSPASEYERLSGRAAQIWWYEQPVHFFTTQNRVVRLLVDGQEKCSYDDTVRITKSVAKSAPWFIVISLGFYIFLLAALEQNLRLRMKAI